MGLCWAACWAVEVSGPVLQLSWPCSSLRTCLFCQRVLCTTSTRAAVLYNPAGCPLQATAECTAAHGVAPKWRSKVHGGETEAMW